MLCSEPWTGPSVRFNHILELLDWTWVRFCQVQVRTLVQDRTAASLKITGSIAFNRLKWRVCVSPRLKIDSACASAWWTAGKIAGSIVFNGLKWRVCIPSTKNRFEPVHRLDHVGPTCSHRWANPNTRYKSEYPRVDRTCLHYPWANALLSTHKSTMSTRWFASSVCD
jgi:hypothetical protein